MERVRHREDVRAVDLFQNIEVFEVFGLDADGNPGVGDHDGGAPGEAFELLCGAEHFVALRHVGGKREVAALVAGKRGDHGGELFGVAGDEPERGAAGGELSGERGADAA